MYKRSLMLAALLLPSLLASAETPPPRTDRVLTPQEQQSLTPDQVVERLRAGNGRFVSGTKTVRDHSALVRDAVGGQAPKAIVLSCVDSRIPVEDVLDQGIGDIFVVRVAGNFENTDILGSMEFATQVSGAKVILVLGHENCGAIKAAIDNVELGNITAMLENIKPAVAAVADYPGEKTSKNPEFVHLVAQQNVRLTMENIRQKSPIVAELETAGKVKIVGALYNLQTGTVDYLD